MTVSSPNALRDLRLARAVVDRSALRRTDAEWLEKAWTDPSVRVVQVSDGRVAVDGDRLVLEETVDVPREQRFFLGEHDGTPYFAAVRDDVGEDPRFRGLRHAGGLLSDHDAGLVVHAVSLANWHATHTHCPRCGGPTVPVQAGHVRLCEADGSEHYPRTDPAVIMAVVDADDRLLLGRQVTWERGRFSTLAGFVEPGESLEAAVRREVFEEAGIEVGDVHYLGSQPWPFPSSLMLGFQAEALTTELHRHDGELAEARWFTRDEMIADIRAGDMVVAPTISISRRLIEHWYGVELPQNGDA